jgi:hypothetical protein
MAYSALLFGLLIGAGVFIGAGVAVVAERARMSFKRSTLLNLTVCLLVLFFFNALKTASRDVDSLAADLLLSFIELPLAAVPSIVAMVVVRRVLRKRVRPNVKAH